MTAPGLRSVPGVVTGCLLGDSARAAARGGCSMARITGTAEYSIAAVSKLTGVSCHALRVWERRYGFPVPLRSASGHRRYAQEQVGLLRALAKLVRAGRPIGELIEDYRAGRVDLG